MNNLKTFDDKIDYLCSSVYRSTDIPSYLQPDRLNSKTMNKFLDYIDNDINNLYEKSRILESVIKETELYFNTIVNEQQNQINNKLKTLENERDSIKQKLCIEYSVPLDGYVSNSDRDGIILPACEIHNNHITVSGKKVNDIALNNVSVSSNSYNYRNNIKNLQQNKPYRSFYVVDNKVSNGITEEIKINFNTPILFNFLTCTVSNCNIDSVTFINEDGTKTIDDEVYNVYKKNKKVKQIYITINANNTQEKIYEIDTTRMHNNFWSIVNNSAYNSYITGESNQININKYSRIEQYRLDFERYENDIKRWERLYG